MKLTTKLVAVFMLVVVVLAAINGYVAVQREVQRFHAEMQAEVRALGDVMDNYILIEFRRSGPDAAVKIIHEAFDQEHHMKVRWVDFDAPNDHPHYPHIPMQQLQPVANDPHFMMQMFDDDQNGHLEAYWMVSLGDQKKAAIELSRSLDDLNRAKNNAVLDTIMRLLATILAAGLATGLLGVWVVGQPLKRLTEKTRRIADGDLTCDPVQVRSRDELGQLATSINDMCEKLSHSQSKLRDETASRISAMEQLRHADRLRTVGRLAAGIAHELGTPLNVVGGRAKMIASGRLSPDEVRQSAEIIQSESDRIAGIIWQLLDFARQNTPKRSQVDLVQLTAQTRELLLPLAEKRNVSIAEIDGSDAVSANVDPNQMQQVLTNLVVNAVQAMPEGGTVEIILRRQQTRRPDSEKPSTALHVAIAVSDQGSGIAEDNVEQLFEPFFTTKGVGEGTGLGLSIAYGIVEEHGGWIDVDSQVGRGSTFTVYLPLEES